MQVAGFSVPFCVVVPAYCVIPAPYPGTGQASAGIYVVGSRPPKARLDAGERVAFHARLVSPPEDGAEVLVHFAAK